MGGMVMHSPPQSMGVMMPPTRPMSWNGGSQLMKITPSGSFMPLQMLCQLAMMLPCVTMTPLGSLVEPDVYCSQPGVSGESGRYFQSAASLSSTSSKLMMDISSGMSMRARSSSTAFMRRVSVMIIFAPESFTMRASLENVRAMRASPGGVMGTAVALAYRQPKKDEINSSPGGSMSRTGQPSPLPVLPIAAATALARVVSRI